MRNLERMTSIQRPILLVRGNQSGVTTFFDLSEKEAL